MYFPSFSAEAKVWVYQLDKPISEDVLAELNEIINQFVDKWSSHGAKLKAEGMFIDEYRLVLCTEGNVEASGCSIDSSVRFIKELGQKYNLNFFNRMQVLIDDNGKKELVHFSLLKEMMEKRIYQPSPKNLSDLRNNETLSISSYLN